MTRLVLVALALALAFNLAVSQTINWSTCQASACGTTCNNCSSATNITNNQVNNPVVLCPQNGTFCFVDTYWANNTWSLQNCTSCGDGGSGSCTGCVWVGDSFSQDFCAANGTCWSVNFNDTQTGNISISQNSTSVNGTNTTTTVVSTSTCNCTNSTTGVVGITGVDNNGNACGCPDLTVNTTSTSNGTTTTVNSPIGNTSLTIVQFGSTLQVCLAVVTAFLVSLLV